MLRVHASVAPARVLVKTVGSCLGAYPGAETVGRVLRAGESAQHLEDKLVLVPRLLPCGECDLCRRGLVGSCPALVERPTAPVAEEELPARFLLPLEPPFIGEAVPVDELFRHAALADALLAPYAGLVRAGTSPGTLAVVIGGGPRAAAAMVVARALGCAVIVVTRGDSERERAGFLAPPFQALAVLDGMTLDPAAAAAEVAAIAKAAAVPAHGACILETTGSDAGRLRALGMLLPGSSAVLFGRARGLHQTAEATPSLAAEPGAGPGLAGPGVLEQLCRQQATVYGAATPHPDLLPELLALLERARVDLAQLTRSVSPDEVAAEYAARRNGSADPLTLPIARFS